MKLEIIREKVHFFRVTYVDAQFSESFTLNIFYGPNKIFKKSSKVISTKYIQNVTSLCMHRSFSESCHDSFVDVIITFDLVKYNLDLQSWSCLDAQVACIDVEHVLL